MPRSSIAEPSFGARSTDGLPLTLSIPIFTIARALSIERKHGADGPRAIAEKFGAFALAGETGAVELWRAVAERYELPIGQRSAE